jgi:hypothetical protein
VSLSSNGRRRRGAHPRSACRRCPGQLLLLEDFGVPRLDFVVREAVLFAQEVDADSTEDCFLAEVRDESRAAVLQQFTEQFSAALLSKPGYEAFLASSASTRPAMASRTASFACSIDATA